MMEKSVFKSIEKILGIPFVDDELTTGAVCFATDEELRADFKIQFISNDVVNYVYGIITLDSNENLASISSLKIPYPVNADVFWQNSIIGKKYRQNHFIKEIESVIVTQLNWETV